MTELITSSYVYQGLSSLLEPLWNDNVGRIFLLTLFSYLMGYLIYGSYLSRFAGGTIALSFSRLGFELSDFINMLPAVILLVIKVIQSSIWKLLRELVLLLLFLGTAFFVGIFLGVLFKRIGSSQFVSPSDTVFLVGAIIYIFGAFGPLLLPEKSKWYRKGLVLSWILQTIGIFLITVGRPSQSSQTPQTNIFNLSSMNIVPRVIWEFNLVMGLIFLIFAPPVLIGRKMADFSVEEKILSRVSQLVLKESLPSLKDFEQHKAIDKPSVYSYISKEDNPLYLVASFRDTTALYIPLRIKSPINGRLVLIAQELIYSVELCISEKERNTKQKDK